MQTHKMQENALKAKKKNILTFSVFFFFFLCPTLKLSLGKTFILDCFCQPSCLAKSSFVISIIINFFNRRFSKFIQSSTEGILIQKKKKKKHDGNIDTSLCLFTWSLLSHPTVHTSILVRFYLCTHTV